MDKKIDKYQENVESQGEELLENEYSLNVEVVVSDDQLEAYILAEGEGAVENILFTPQMINEKLAEKNICFGILEEKILQFCQEPQFNENILIAQGTAPSKGNDGEVQLMFELDKEMSPMVLGDGTVDYKSLSNIESVRKDQVLAMLILPTLGQSGKTILGEEIEGIWGQTVLFPKGNNTYVSEDGMSLLAKTDGHVTYQGGTLQVNNVYHVTGDVDLKTGNIFFWGSVVIDGDVREGFRVVADGDVFVKGLIEGAHIKANGNIVVVRGINGMNVGTLVSEGNVCCGYIENCTIRCKGKLETEIAINSTIECDGDMEVRGKKGAIIGGHSMIGGILRVQNIGNNNDTNTKITFKSVKNDPRYDELQKNLAQLNEKKMKNNGIISLLMKIHEHGSLPEAKKKELLMQLEAQKNIFMEIEQLESDIAMYKNDISTRTAERLLLECRNHVYENTVIYTEKNMYYVDETIGTCKFVEKDGFIERV